MKGKTRVSKSIKFSFEFKFEFMFSKFWQIEFELKLKKYPFFSSSSFLKNNLQKLACIKKIFRYTAICK